MEKLCPISVTYMCIDKNESSLGNETYVFVAGEICNVQR